MRLIFDTGADGHLICIADGRKLKSVTKVDLSWSKGDNVTKVKIECSMKTEKEFVSSLSNEAEELHLHGDVVTTDDLAIEVTLEGADEADDGDND
jgi:hypothetical protein